MSIHKKILCLDIGSKTCGIAKTDALGITIQPVRTIRYDGQHKINYLFSELTATITEEHPQLILIGLPLNMDDSEGPQVQKTKTIVQGLKNHLKSKHISPDQFQWDYCDERNTSEDALEFLKDQGLNSAKRKENVDMFAAVFILKRYLNEF